MKSVNEEELILACVNTRGYNDGYLVMKTEDVYRMDYDSYYEKKSLDLYKIKQQKHEEIFLNKHYYYGHIKIRNLLQQDLKMASQKYVGIFRMRT